MSELVSIIMPSYSTAKFISETIESVLAQTYMNQALEAHPDADILIFGFDYVKDSKIVRKKLMIYTYAESVGMNQYRESTWFKGYNDKFFYDKGAWIACVFPKIKFLMICYFTVRFKKYSDLSVGMIFKRLKQGASGFKKMESYNGNL